ncbi:hypothetical protein HUU61_00100 [Rhodopseudomonas palustris]|uniref:Uncharacterized protein n=1 Tax=Thiospirillum jenense TaxID=1653858 RepID=A0A839HCL1_9GAMM|nr:hypothetical protein [Thiospirillum jenense]MBB1089679.1 hypothetical protein [Rhodopseudomonas palustris]MBB1124779.1 hypothetical protein [Thiospirillum jenense]
MIFFSQYRFKRAGLAIKLLMAVLTVALFFMSYQWGNHWQHNHSLNTLPSLQGVQLQPPLVLPLLSLYDAAGAPFDLIHEQHNWALLVLIPNQSSITQKTIKRLIEIINRLAGQPTLQQALQLLLIMPMLESQQNVKLTILPQLHLLTASDRQLEQLRLVLGDHSDHNTQPSASDSAALPPFYLINSNHQVIVLFPAVQSAASIADDLKHVSMAYLNN